MPPSDLLQITADRLAITDLIYRYCRAMDRIDPELCNTIWHEDATADYGEAIFQGSAQGFTDYVCATHRGLMVHSHQVTNIILDLDGDLAASEAYYFTSLRFQPGTEIKQLSIWGRYLDKWSRRSGRWGVDQRKTIVDFDEMRDVTPMSDMQGGSRDRLDPSYAILRNYPGSR